MNDGYDDLPQCPVKDCENGTTNWRRHKWNECDEDCPLGPARSCMARVPMPCDECKKDGNDE